MGSWEWYAVQPRPFNRAQAALQPVSPSARPEVKESDAAAVDTLLYPSACAGDEAGRK